MSRRRIEATGLMGGGAGRRWSVAFFTWMVAVLPAGCLGEIGSPGLRAGSPDGPADGVATPMVPRAWLLTNAQYASSIRDLFGPGAAELVQLPPSVDGHGFDNSAEANIVRERRAHAYAQTAQRIAAAVVADPAQLGEVYPCDGFADAVCTRESIGSIGRRVYRRALTDAELDAYAALFDSSRDALDGETAVALVIETMLQSGSFLYRSELGDDGVPDRALTSYERASLLSYTLWNSTPDEELLALAADGSLLEAPVLEAQVERMMADPRVADGFHQFVHGLFGLDDLDDQTRSVDGPADWPATRESMREETRRFAEFVLTSGEVDSSLNELLTARYAFVDANLAPIYGLEAPADGWQRVPHALPGRAGMLTQASVLVAHSLPDGPSPPRVGKLLSERFLCFSIPPPPDNIPVDQDVVGAARTTREFFELATARPECTSCHAYLNPAGFGFSHFDQLGRYQDEENGYPVDATVSFEIFGWSADPLDGMEQIGGALAAAEDTQRCFVRQHVRYGMGRADREGDAPFVEELEDRFVESGGDLRRLLADFVLHPHLYTRRMPTGER